MDVLIVIRAAGERTEDACLQLIRDQNIPSEQIKLVREVPFSASLRKSLELGIVSGRKWTFCVDADVLLRPGSIEKMISLASEQPDNVCEIQSFILDKFFGGPRPGGIHLYRTSLLPLALNNIPSEGINIRPESHMLNTMTAMGHPFFCVGYISGIHDDHQNYRDIFRKSWVQAIKHGDRYSLFMKIWKERARHDPDFEIALKGFAAGVLHNGQAYINKDLDIYRFEFEKLDITEKRPMALHEVTLQTIEDRILNWKNDELYQRMFPTLQSISPTPLGKSQGYGERILQIRRRSLMDYIKYRLASRLLKMAKRIQTKIDSKEKAV